jgi:hypothetical protein
MQRVSDRQHVKRSGVLDDDQAMLPDDTEDWREDDAGLLVAYPDSPAHSSFVFAAPTLSLNALPVPVVASPIHTLCRYRC